MPTMTIKASGLSDKQREEFKTAWRLHNMGVITTDEFRRLELSTDKAKPLTFDTPLPFARCSRCQSTNPSTHVNCIDCGSPMARATTNKPVPR
jgi:hypothetical protein